MPVLGNLRNMILRRMRMGIFVTVLALGWTAAANEKITITNPEPNTTVVRIDEPTVTQATIDYPTVTFRPGDAVTVDAGGCVQTGGSGKTWKRYVDPQGANSQNLYFGEIFIPGATLQFERLSSARGTTLLVPSSVDLPGELYLRLGYSDNHYGDNGYWGHDDGTGDQCKGAEGMNAWVTLRIVHGGSGSLPDPEHPYDLVWSDADGNAFPFDPRWTSQTPPPGYLPGPALCGLPWLQPCTTQTPSLHVGRLCAIGKELGKAGELGGHANWGPVTYDGYAYWDGHSAPLEDDDYNINIVRTDDAYYTSGNPNYVHTEFSAGETIDHFNSSWWQAFHDAVDNSDDAARRFIDGKYIVEMGVAGLDCAHSCGSELHPVYAMALHIQDDPRADGWAIFARNEGDEGFCGDEELALDVSSVTLTIPWRPGATGVTLKDGSQFSTNNNQVEGPFITPHPGQNVNITFNLPRPDAGARANGVLYLTWTGAPTSVLARPTLPINRTFRTAVPDSVKQEAEPSRQISSLVAGMSPELRSEYAATAPATDLTKDNIPLRVTVNAPSQPSHPRIGGTSIIEMHTSTSVSSASSGKKLAPVRAIPDPKKQALDQKRISILQKAYPHLVMPSTVP